MTKLRRSKKHRGSKDPYKQIKRQNAKVKHLVDKPPKHADIQEIPKRWLQIRAKTVRLEEENRRKQLGLEEDTDRKGKNDASGHDTGEPPKGKKKKKKKEQGKGEKLLSTVDFLSTGYYPKNLRPLKPVPTVTQKPGESLKSFIRRSCQATNHVINESKFQDKFNVDVRRDEQGKVSKMVSFNDIPEMLTPKQQLEIEKRKQRKKEKLEKRKAERLEKRKLIQEDEEAEKQFHKKEKVKFGDVALAPPTLRPPKKPKQPKPKSAEEKEKERIRQNAVEAYRLLKAKKNLPDRR